jgi:hypothetical protein
MGTSPDLAAPLPDDWLGAQPRRPQTPVISISRPSVNLATHTSVKNGVGNLSAGLIRATATTALTALVSLLAPPGGNAATAMESSPSVSRFVALEAHALSESYTEVYQVTGANTGIVEVFQEAPRGVFPFLWVPKTSSVSVNRMNGLKLWSASS